MKNAQREGPGIKTSRFCGVFMDKSKARQKRPAWRAVLYINGIRILSGYFSDEVEAAIEHDRMAIEHDLTHHLNFPYAWLKVRIL